MNKKLVIKSGICHQLYAAIFASIGIVFLFLFFFILALFLKEPAIKSILALYPFIYPLIAVWIIFLLVRIFLQSTLEVDEKGLTKKRFRKVLWSINWEALEKIEYFKMSWHFFLSPNIYKGELVLTYRKDEKKKEIKVNLFRKDIEKIISTFEKNITIY